MASVVPRRRLLLSLATQRTTTTAFTSATTKIATTARLSRAAYSSSAFQTGPAPPRLPASEQAEFERLQRTANTQEGFNPSATPADFVIPSTPTATKSAAASSSGSTTSGVKGIVDDNAAPTPLRKGAPPEFEGDINPKTGEVGGPKNEPLRWGAAGDYSYNGRVTDF